MILLDVSLGLGAIVGVSVGAFLLVIMLLVALLLFARKKLTPQGLVKLDINDGKRVIEIEPGDTVLTALSTQDIFLPSACGGGGTCIQCECHVNSGGGEALPTETPHFSRKELKE